MKDLLKLYHFLGSIKFAIILIASTALFVIAGTFLEAHTESHLFSASLTYQNPIFLALIWGFFLNILISALRRWPFQFKHIPFLITHLGLLMLLGGVMIKSKFGIQGSMGIVEGQASKRLFIPHSKALHLEKKDPRHPQKTLSLDFDLQEVIRQKLKFDDVEIRLADYAQHSHERRQTWIKGPQAILSGLEPIAVTHYQELKDFNPSQQVRFHHAQAQAWQIAALTTIQPVVEVAKQIYLQGLKMKISDVRSGEVLKEGLLSDMQNPTSIGRYTLNFRFDWSETHEPQVEVWIDHEKMRISLSGEHSLFNQNISSSYRGKHPLAIDFARDPLLLIVQDDHEDDHLFFFNPHGEIYTKSFKHDQLSSLYIYDDGFQGYGLSIPFPFEDFSQTRMEKEQAELLALAIQLRQSLHQNTKLSPPLKLLKSAVDESSDLAETILLFLKSWEDSGGLLHDGKLLDPINKVVQLIDWHQMSLTEQYACGWLCVLLNEIDLHMREGKNFSQILKERGWPFIQAFAVDDPQEQDQKITLFAQQLWAAADQLPRPPVMPEEIPTQALSAYLRSYGITLNNIRETVETSNGLRVYHAAHLLHENFQRILPIPYRSTQNLGSLLQQLKDDKFLLETLMLSYEQFHKHIQSKALSSPFTLENLETLLQLYKPLDLRIFTKEENAQLTASLDTKGIFLETPLTLHLKKAPPLQKWEENHPLITLEIKKGSHKEYINLAYDKYGTGLLWPLLKGEYVARFQPLFIDIPYKVRLHDARQINYPGTQQAYSYESDVIITDLRDQTEVEKTISMNNVHETKDGYRFYLASLSPPYETTAQRVQVVVNHDPAKYYLTYPGALFLSLGILLLFWMKPYKTKK